MYRLFLSTFNIKEEDGPLGSFIINHPSTVSPGGVELFPRCDKISIKIPLGGLRQSIVNPKMRKPFLKKIEKNFLPK